MIADHQALVRSAIRLLLETRGFKVVGEACSCEDALQQIAKHPADVALVDVAMPRMDGIEVTKHIRTGYPETRVIALTTAEDEHFVRAALNAGAAAYLPKSADAEELMLAIQAVIAGRNYIHPKVAHALEAARLARRMVDLSAREAEVIRLIALGYTHKEVADQLHVSSKTVETHKSRAQQKLGVTSRVEIIRVAVERGWIMAGENARERIALALR